MNKILKLTLMAAILATCGTAEENDNPLISGSLNIGNNTTSGEIVVKTNTTVTGSITINAESSLTNEPNCTMTFSKDDNGHGSLTMADSATFANAGSIYFEEVSKDSPFNGTIKGGTVILSQNAVETQLSENKSENAFANLSLVDYESVNVRVFDDGSYDKPTLDKVKITVEDEKISEDMSGNEKNLITYSKKNALENLSNIKDLFKDELDESRIKMDQDTLNIDERFDTFEDFTNDEDLNTNENFLKFSDLDKIIKTGDPDESGMLAYKTNKYKINEKELNVNCIVIPIQNNININFSLLSDKSTADSDLIVFKGPSKVLEHEDITQNFEEDDIDQAGDNEKSGPKITFLGNQSGYFGRVMFDNIRKIKAEGTYSLPSNIVPNTEDIPLKISVKDKNEIDTNGSLYVDITYVNEMNLTVSENTEFNVVEFKFKKSME